MMLGNLFFDNQRISYNLVDAVNIHLNEPILNIKYINNQPHCYNKRLKKDIRFVLLHFQGRNKRVMTNWFEKTN